MKRIVAMTACALALPGATLAATRNYDTATFEGVSVAEGITANITVGAARSVRAETRSEDFEALRISVKDNVLRIDRPAGSWFSGLFGNLPDYQVDVAIPSLRSLDASSGAEVKVTGSLAGDLSVHVSSGGEVEVSGVKGGKVEVHTSSGSEASIAGNCVSLEAHSSSGSELDAGNLNCESVSLHSSSGSTLSVAATKSVMGEASSGSSVRVRGKSATVKVDTSSGADVSVKD